MGVTRPNMTKKEIDSISNVIYNMKIDRKNKIELCSVLIPIIARFNSEFNSVRFSLNCGIFKPEFTNPKTWAKRIFEL